MLYLVPKNRLLILGWYLKLLFFNCCAKSMNLALNNECYSVVVVPYYGKEWVF